MSAGDLDGRIAGVLQRAKALPADVAVLLGEVEAALAKAGDELSRARETAFDPLSSTAAVARPGAPCSRVSSGMRVSWWRVDRLAREACERGRAGRAGATCAASMRLLLLGVMRLPGGSRTCGRLYAVPLASFLHEIAAVDAEINNANRLKLGPWLDRVETIARPGVGDVDTHKIVGMHTRLPVWDHDQHRAGQLLWPPQPERLDVAAMVPEPLRQREEAVAAEAREATKVSSQLEEANRLARGARRRVLAGSWG